MFATQHHHMDAMQDGPKKRAREDEQDISQFPVSSADHRDKRVQCLPLRSSPRVSQQASPPSSSDGPGPGPGPGIASHLSPWESLQQDHEMDVMETLNAPPPHRLEALESSEFDRYNATARIPTPMQPSFAAQVRGQNCEWAGPGPTLNGTINLGHHGTGFDNEQAVPRAMANDTHWQDVQRNRRLPSPVPEGDDVISYQEGDSPEVILDSSVLQNQLSDQLELSSISTPHAMEHPNAVMDVQPPSDSHLDPNGDPTSSSPTRRGHTRSKHTVNNWTWQPGMKKSFSIGYRSDCEKCRLKVPGHFNHIIISQ